MPSKVFLGPTWNFGGSFHYTRGALKMLDVKMQDVKQTDGVAGQEIAGHETNGRARN